MFKHVVWSKTLRSETLATQATRAKSYDDVHNISTVPCGKSKMVYFAPSIMKKIVLFLFIS